MTISQRQFTEDKKDIFEQWMTEEKQLIQDVYILKGLPCLSYQKFAKLCPSYIVKKKYIALMACDACTEFDWIIKAVNRALKKNHICTKTDDCYVCQLIQLKKKIIIFM